MQRCNTYISTVSRLETLHYRAFTIHNTPVALTYKLLYAFSLLLLVLMVSLVENMQGGKEGGGVLGLADRYSMRRTSKPCTKVYTHTYASYVSTAASVSSASYGIDMGTHFKSGHNALRTSALCFHPSCWGVHSSAL